jgi:hypothetical protein
VNVEHVIMLLMALGIANAHAKLPPPSPEEQAAVEKKKAAQQAQLEKEKKLLEAAQDRVVQHYRKEKGGGAPAAGGPRPETENMPKTTKELPGGVGPRPTQPQSGEAHSAPAK